MGTKFLHFRDIAPLTSGGVNPRGGLTVAFQGFEPSEEPRLIEWSYALCSVKDNFNKATGRGIAADRLLLNHDHGFRGTAFVHDEKELAMLLTWMAQDRFGLVRKFSRNRRKK